MKTLYLILELKGVRSEIVYAETAPDTVTETAVPVTLTPDSRQWLDDHFRDDGGNEDEAFADILIEIFLALGLEVIDV